MTPGHARVHPDWAPRGFVLVGVVMMVLALTILGLSLFSLSGYEAQFMNRSLDEQQALQFAMGGLDRARFALTVSPQHLENVKEDLPYEYVTYARAMQDQGGPVADSTGVVLGSGADVQILVQAEYRGVTKRVQGFYIPVTQTNYYERLMSVAAGGIEVNGTVGGSAYDACGSVFLGTTLSPDSIWVNQAGSSSLTCASTANSTYGINRRYVPVPAVSSYFGAPHAGITTIPYDGTGNQIDLPGTSGVVSYWYTSQSATEFSVRPASGPLTIQVNGMAVWLLPRGLRSDGFLTIKSGGDPNACLVIVARDGFDPAFNDYGAIWPFGGFDIQIPVVFVTDGSVKLEAYSQPAAVCRANNISIFANHVLLTGPTVDWTINPSHNLMTLSYGASRMNPILEQLMAAGALPNAVSGVPFALRAGTWRILQ